MNNKLMFITHVSLKRIQHHTRVLVRPDLQVTIVN